MHLPLLIGGDPILQNSFEGRSPFYERYTFPVAAAGSLDVSRAIGNARQADRSSLSVRLQRVKRAAEKFSFTDEDLEHAVRTTGMPLRLIRNAFSEIPSIFLETVENLSARFIPGGGSLTSFLEPTGPKRLRVLAAQEGFCYAITPGNDPRASALVAANLACLGIPFILQASAKDSAAPQVVKALWEAGFDQRFCSLIYFDRSAGGSQGLHFRLVDASASVWTFGPKSLVDQTLRREIRGRRAVIDLAGMAEPGLDVSQLLERLSGKISPAGFNQARVEEDSTDHFAGKTIIRHTSGNCAMVTSGPWSDDFGSVLYESTGYALACTATRSAMVVDGPGWVQAAKEFYQSRVVGDPLAEETEIGYIHPRDLDQLEAVLKANGARIRVDGYERLSPIQASPAVVTSQEDVPVVFAQEIPAYLLAVRECSHTGEAVDWINRNTPGEPRLAVSFFNLSAEELRESLQKVKAHTALVNLPTTRWLPTLHEGNDYIRLLSQSKLVWY